MDKKTETIRQADVVIVGGGVGGFLAAVAAARSGAKTLVIEKEGYFGGTANTGLVGTIWSLDFKGRQVVNGIPWEFVQRLINAGGAPGFMDFNTSPLQPEFCYRFKTIPYNAQIYKIVADEMVTEAGADVLFHTRLAGVSVKDGVIDSITVYKPDGFEKIKGRIFVDCTGDAILADMAGCESLPWETQELQPMSACFKMAGIDIDAFETMTVEERRALAEKGVADGDLPRLAIGGKRTGNPGEMVFNIVRVPGLDGSKAEDLTKAELMGRQQVKKIVQFHKKYIRGFENAYITDIAQHIGVRETRRIRGFEILDGDKVLAGDVPKNSIALGTGPCDAHERGVGWSLWAMPEAPFGIPYGCLVPEGIGNMYISGRNISANRAANAAMRHMGTCMAIGHAVGTAAAMCVSLNSSPSELPVEQLQEKLIEQGAYIK